MHSIAEMALLMEVIEARSVEELATLQHRLHDVWLQLPAAIVATDPTAVRLEGLDERSSLVPIRSVGPLMKFERRKARIALVVERVSAMELVDHAKVGSLNLAKIWFDGESSTVHVEGHIPVELCLRVEQLDVRVEIADDAVVSGRTWGLRPRSA